MATTAARALRLLTLLSRGAIVPARELRAILGVAERTVRRDVDALRALGYDVEAVKGVGGGYRLRAGTRLPPLVLDEDQVVAIAVALQTAPSVLAGIGESQARALQTVRQVMPARLRVESDAFVVTSIPNQWEFAAAPLDAALVHDVGAAVRRRHVLRVEVRTDAGDDEPARVEPHQLVVWAGRWYVVAYDLDRAAWRVLRLDRLAAKAPTNVPFDERPLPAPSAAAFVMRTVDRGDHLAAWPCVGSAVLDVPPDLVAEFAPGGAVVERVDARRARLRMGAWSWTGLAGLYITFAAGMSEVEPGELRSAFADVRERLGGLAAP